VLSLSVLRLEALQSSKFKVLKFKVRVLNLLTLNLELNFFSPQIALIYPSPQDVSTVF
jgi:hypothetical protein